MTELPPELQSNRDAIHDRVIRRGGSRRRRRHLVAAMVAILIVALPIATVAMLAGRNTRTRSVEAIQPSDTEHPTTTTNDRATTTTQSSTRPTQVSSPTVTSAPVSTSTVVQADPDCVPSQVTATFGFVNNAQYSLGGILLQNQATHACALSGFPVVRLLIGGQISRFGCRTGSPEITRALNRYHRLCLRPSVRSRKRACRWTGETGADRSVGP